MKQHEKKGWESPAVQSLSIKELTLGGHGKGQPGGKGKGGGCGCGPGANS